MDFSVKLFLELNIKNRLYSILRTFYEHIACRSDDSLGKLLIVGNVGRRARGREDSRSYLDANASTDERLEWLENADNTKS